MAHNNNSRKCEGLCQKIYNSVGPLRSRIRRISHHPQSSISNTSEKKPLSKTTVGISNGEREIAIVQARKQEVDPLEKGGHVEGKRHKHEKIRSKKDDDDSMHDGKFSDYISKVKNRMIKTVSNVGGGRGGGGEIPPRRDSFNDKVASYINRAKMKIRKTTNVGVDNTLSLKDKE